jgi:hypothetical protein
VDVAQVWKSARRASRLILSTALPLLAGGCASDLQRDPTVASEAKAIRFLQREVPAWPQENHCFSCHNNGDAARALYTATRRGYRLPARALAETTAWVARPDRWEHNKGNPALNDQRLANVQFGASLQAAVAAGKVNDPRPLQQAAQKIAADQGPDGAWHIDPQNAVGSPVAYATTLATYVAWQMLKEANAPGTSAAIRKAENWLKQAGPDNVPAAATLLLALAPEPNLSPKREACLETIRRAQAPEGGWGPYADSPPEPFDTALVLLALAQLSSTPEVGLWIRRGRHFLATEQRSDGSWAATTRPPGGTSYAQRISTTAWATLALLTTRE